ncbi:MAG: hypothetical protein QOG91_674 [Candidatus Parcubacteria bacterium]|jgi:hypothetical protein|nr:hypothetical protein [Candidatus Parcubacteria bacterium]
MNALSINIDLIYFLGIIGTLIGLAWYASARLTRVETKLEGLDTRLSILEGRGRDFFKYDSPITLSDEGEQHLIESGLKKYIEDNKEDFFGQCAAEHDLSTAYDIQEAAFRFFDEHEFEPQFEITLKEYAYNQGVELSVLRRVAGVYLRNLLLEKMGAEEKDLDQPTT